MQDECWINAPFRHNGSVGTELSDVVHGQERPLVLIIDAEESARDLYGHWFTALGFQVMCAVGLTGLGYALRRERPQLIVTELSARDLTLKRTIRAVAKRSNDAMHSRDRPHGLL